MKIGEWLEVFCSRWLGQPRESRVSQWRLIQMVGGASPGCLLLYDNKWISTIMPVIQLPQGWSIAVSGRQRQSSRETAICLVVDVSFLTVRSNSELIVGASIQRLTVVWSGVWWNSDHNQRTMAQHFNCRLCQHRIQNNYWHFVKWKVCSMARFHQCYCVSPERNWTRKIIDSPGLCNWHLNAHNNHALIHTVCTSLILKWLIKLIRETTHRPNC